MGEIIEDVVDRVKDKEIKGYVYLYDMLGEGVCIMGDVDWYYDVYVKVIKVIGKVVNGCGLKCLLGIFVKLLVIYLCFEFFYCECVMEEILLCFKVLCFMVKEYDIGFIVDVEEVDCFELFLDIIEVVFCDNELNGWIGFGFVV